MAQSRFVPGQYIGPYRLIKKLGEGAFGEVWLTERASNLVARQAALKLPFDPDLDLVRQEAQTWIHASGHPNIVPVWDADIDANGQAYIASEYVAGGNLNGWLNDWIAQHGGKAPSQEAAVRIMVGILNGLEYLHSLKPHPVIHRDLKPENILLQGGIPRLTDFGIARVMRSTSFTQHISGTPPYMAPEVFSGKYNEKSDLWAAGVIFYRLLTGALPFPQSDMNALMFAIVHGQPNSLPASFPSGVQKIFQKIFQKDLSARYASAQSMKQDVEALLYAPRPQPQPAPPPQQNPVRTPQPSPPITSSRRGFLLGTVVAAAAGGIYALNHNQAAKGNGASDGSQSDAQNNSNQGGKSVPDDTSKPKTNPTDGAEMAWIPAGTFQMGSSGEYDGKPIHSVPLSGFWMYKTPVTVAQFRKYDEANGRNYDWTKNKPSWGWIDEHPMVNVSWDEASAYAKWAGVALPTEAQWEYGARGGLEGKNYPWGDTYDRSKLRCSEKEWGDAKSTAAVASYPANGYGLYDMAGNVCQWCADWYDKNYYSTEAARGSNPTGPASGSSRVLRGGSWGLNSEDLFRCAHRINNYPYGRYGDDGFRCCSPG